MDDELVELLWQNGGVVAQPQPQANQRSSLSGVTAEDEAAGWLHDGDLYSQLWHSIGNGGGAARSGAGSSRSGGEVGSSFCGSNLVAAPAPHDHDGALLPTPAPEEEERVRAAASSSGVSFKRARGGDEDAGDETRPSSRRPAAKRRARAAEVHNQSERRRRDRINEKMRALQQLVPHCNKTDKASVLDEAIEYLKSLQMQVQIMWMTTGMAPMMFPGAHQIMSPMAMGLNSACMPAAQGLGHLQRPAHYMNNPVPNQMPQMGQSASINAQNVPNQMQNDHHCGPRNPFLHPDDTIAATPQVQGMFPYGSPIAQQNDIKELLVSPGIASSSDRKPPCPMINLQATRGDEQKKPEQLVLEE